MGKAKAGKKVPLWSPASVSKTLNLLSYERLCLGCKKPFIAHRKDKLCCSDKCYARYWYVKRTYGNT